MKKHPWNEGGQRWAVNLVFKILTYHKNSYIVYMNFQLIFFSKKEKLVLVILHGTCGMARGKSGEFHYQQHASGRC